ncbi:hypothetical protein K7432_006529 [Basidiobolus ranarum]|uniref:Uncharacterized protein n=1 Tax=Basidiobolus ranarum TaxID=34480 RepID=A0ABR2WUU3_9FUNG
MSTESDRESLRRRREARQRRILASGEDRLNRIKASFIDANAAATPASTTSDSAPKETDLPDHSSIPTIKKSTDDEVDQIFSTPATAPKNISETTFVDSFKAPSITSTGSPSSSSQFSTPSLVPRALPNNDISDAEDPLLSFRQEWQSILSQNLSGASTPNPGALPFNPESLLSGPALASLLSQQSGQAGQPQQSTPSWWFTLRVVAVGVLVAFVFYMEWMGTGMSENMMSDRFGRLKDNSPENIYGESRVRHMVSKVHKFPNFFLY